MSMSMRAKVKLNNIQSPNPGQEDLVFNAVAKNEAYPDDGSDEDNTYAKFSPSAEFKISVCNPALIGKFTVGETYYVDFTPVE